MNFDFNITKIHRVIMVGKEEYPEKIIEFKSKKVQHNEMIYHISGVSKVFFNGKELMTKDELAVMDGGKCILQLRGVRPFYSKKFDITAHKRYKELSDFNKKNAFDVEQYMRCKLRMRADDEVEVFEIEVTDDDL